ncbi:MAG: AMP-binding protein [Candidatus Symbiothrix sp.]|jgi:long-chain acyl-CoA synthetase|nr:AMP-binding protein [Candidatus Symbiothrix sp.]
MEKENFVKLFETAFKNNFDNKALTEYGTPNTVTFGELAKEITKLHLLFEECQVKKGDKIALIGKSSNKWCITYLATTTYGAVVVPVLQDFSANDVQHIVNHSDAVLLFSDNSIWEQLEEEKLPDLKGTVSLSDFSFLYQKENETFTTKHIQTLFEKKYPTFTAQDIHYDDISDDEILVLNYTSGTTGFSKGVMITGGNLSGNLTFAHKILGLEAGGTILSFLPLAHAYGAAFEFLYALSEGCHVTLLGKTPAPKILLKAFAEVKPVLILSVPLILEKIYKNMILPMLSTVPMKLALSIPVLDAQIYAQIRKKLIAAFGGNFKQIVVGGAPLNAEVDEFLSKIKLPLSVGYGMTECAPLISVTLFPDAKPHSCGQPLDSMQVRIDSEDPHTIAGEIQVYGQNVMRGYYKNEEATKAVFTEDGWLRTGDLGTLDEADFIFIRGRSKSMILSASGQNIYPEEIEAKLDNLPFVLESLVVDRGGKLVALVYPDYDAMDSTGTNSGNLAEIMAHNKETLNSMVASYERIAHIELYPNEFEKTPKKSIKRYLYAGSAER